MAITINIYYTGEGDNALRFAQEMRDSGIVERIRQEEGNLRYEYFAPLEHGDRVLLVDRWQDQAALDRHHLSPLMGEIAALRDKYDLRMQVERYVEAEPAADDDKYVRV